MAGRGDLRGLFGYLDPHLALLLPEVQGVDERGGRSALEGALEGAFGCLRELKNE